MEIIGNLILSELKELGLDKVDEQLIVDKMINTLLTKLL